ncbi:hypothetical protein Tco_0779536 [Tanacetum coccineum]
MDMLNTHNEAMILGRPFTATIHAEIDVFNKEISLGIRGDRVTFYMDKKIHNFTTPIGEIYMINATSNTPSDASSRVEETNDVHNDYNQEQGRSRFLYDEIGIQSLLESYSCGSKGFHDSMTDFEVEMGYVRVYLETTGFEVDVEDRLRSRIQSLISTSTFRQILRSVLCMLIAIRARRWMLELVIDDDVRESVREDVPDHVTTDGAVESAAMSERIGMLERDNMRLVGMLDVERQRVDRLRRSMSYVHMDLRQILRFCFYDRVRIGRLEAYARRHLGYRS